MTTFKRSENSIKHSVRAKYIIDENGMYRLAKVQRFSVPKFTEEGYECEVDQPLTPNDVFNEVEADETDEKVSDPSDIYRAVSRAKQRAFDYILCNPDLDTFATFTYSPEAVDDKASYDECYHSLKTWLSNRVQRKGLKYVIAPEYTKAGDIHFHAIMNSSALALVCAVSAKNGRKLTHNGKPLYNVSDWGYGFTSAEIIGSDTADRDKVAKYIFKYMGKQMGQRIGGRYVLTGGDLKSPVYLYGESVDEFFDGQDCKWDNHVDLSAVCGIQYDEWSFI